MPLFTYTRSFRGPTAPRILEPPKLLVTNFAAKVPAPILIKSDLLVLNAADNVYNPPFKFPPIICCAAVPAFAASKNANPAPVSKRLIENDRFLLAVRFLPRLTTIFVLVGVLPTGTPLQT